MYLSAISYQPMSVSQNLKKQNSTINFKAAKFPVTGKFPISLVRERAARKQELDRLRKKINELTEQKGTADEIDRLINEVARIIAGFNRKINDFVYNNRKDFGDYVGFYLH